MYVCVCGGGGGGVLDRDRFKCLVGALQTLVCFRSVGQQNSSHFAGLLGFGAPQPPVRQTAIKHSAPTCHNPLVRLAAPMLLRETKRRLLLQQLWPCIAEQQK